MKTYSELREKIKHYSFPGMPHSWENALHVLFFVALWGYLWIRADAVFLIHDEIISKWGYMVSWNYLPFHGYIDANNHFLNSFLGGLFIRLFNSDATWVVRMGNLLSFPLYFWSIFALRKYFTHRLNYYLLLVSLCFTPFLIEFFGMARGYGMSLAFMLFALQQTMDFLSRGRVGNLLLSLLAILLAVFANLTLLPIAIMGVIYLGIYLWKTGRRKWILIALIPLLPLGYLIHYAYFLQGIGKLYMGGQQGFFEITVHSLTRYLWNTENSVLDTVLLASFIFLMITLVKVLLKSKSWFKPQSVFLLLLAFGVVVIFVQNLALGVNYPEDRGALYLLVFYFGAVAFSLDIWKFKYAAFPFLILFVFFFFKQLNFNYFQLYQHEHYHKELLSSIPDDVNGIPPSTGVYRNWAMDDEWSRSPDIPMYAMQWAPRSEDTLTDYVICTNESRPGITQYYQPKYKDEISGITLFERNHFLERSKVDENTAVISGNNEFFRIYAGKLQYPMFLRCSGYVSDLSIFKDAILAFSAEDSKTQSPAYYQGYNLVRHNYIDENGQIRFDFTFAVNTYENADQIKVYLWNKHGHKLNAEINLEVYRIW